MERKEFLDGLKRHFKIEQGFNYIDQALWLMLREYRIDIIKLDDHLHSIFGEYEEERKMSMNELIKAEYGASALHWVDKAI